MAMLTCPHVTPLANRRLSRLVAQIAARWLAEWPAQGLAEWPEAGDVESPAVEALKKCSAAGSPIRNCHVNTSLSWTSQTSEERVTSVSLNFEAINVCRKTTNFCSF